MVSRVRAIWAEHGKTIIGVILVIVLVVALGRWIINRMINVPSWPLWMGFNKHDLWDVLELLIIPAALALVAYFFRRAERNTDFEIAEEGRQEAALQTYFDRMAELLLSGALRMSGPVAEGSAVARARTSTALRRLDAPRNRTLLQFLYESDLIANDDPVHILTGLDLSSANLQGVNLEGADLQAANLEGADLQGANLQAADLRYANLQGADLQGADLQGADLQEARLQGARLQGAYLQGANLERANLEGATITAGHLTMADSFKDVILPDGTKL
jgi:uncharacterized protein YjbI with pentapeptide repeats